MFRRLWRCVFLLDLHDLLLRRYRWDYHHHRCTLQNPPLHQSQLKCGLHYTKRSLMSWVVVIPKEGRASVAVPALLLVWHRPLGTFLCDTTYVSQQFVIQWYIRIPHRKCPLAFHKYMALCLLCCRSTCGYGLVIVMQIGKHELYRFLQSIWLTRAKCDYYPRFWYILFFRFLR